MRSCKECTGICCSTVAGETPPETWIDSHFAQCRVSTLKRHGATLDIVLDTGIPCANQDSSGGCNIYSARPALCKSYYCHGKLFERRGSLQAPA